MAGDTLLIDDFNDGIDPNELGGFSYIYAHKGAKCKASYYLLKSDNSSTNDYCLKISWQTPVSSDAGCGFSTKVLDIQKADYLTFSLKANSSLKGVRLAIKDMNQKEAMMPLNRYTTSNSTWQEVIIPLSDYKGLDFSRISSLTFVFSPHTPEGSFLIDDIEFRK
jgi:hypothetical protein